MLSNKTFIKIISGALIGGAILAVGGMAFAESTESNILNGNRGAFDRRPGIMNSGEISTKRGNIKERVQAALNDIVAGGTITQEKADEFLAYMTKQEEERKEAFEKFKDMTPEERKAQLENNKEQYMGKSFDIFADAVAEGILTGEQADAVRDKMRQLNESDRKRKISDALSSAVQKGTIDQEQMDKVLQYIDDKGKQMKDIMDKTKDMTPEERRDYIKDNMGGKENPISQLVDEGILTKEQMQEIFKAMPHNEFNLNGFKGKRSKMGSRRGEAPESSNE